MRHEVTTRRVLYEIPEMRSVRVRDAEFPGSDGHPISMAIYEAVRPPVVPPPAVVLMEGYPDAGFAAKLGCRFMEMEWSISMAQLIAASGMTAITHTNRDPRPDAAALLSYLAAEGETVGIDGSRLGIWATSGHSPVALFALPQATCAVFINPMIPEETPRDLKPMFIVRSGRDETPGLNVALDRFISNSLSANQPLKIVNQPDAPHAFDLNHDSASTRHILADAVSFLRFHLNAF